MPTKRTLAALIAGVITAASLAACADDPTPTPTPTPSAHVDVMVTLGQPFEMGENHRAFVDADGFAIDYVGVVSDSRCAVDVVCITAGRAVVEFNIRERTADPMTRYLFGIGDSGPEPPDQVIGGYRITLTALEPQPHSDGRELDYRATLTVVEAR